MIQNNEFNENPFSTDSKLVDFPLKFHNKQHLILDSLGSFKLILDQMFLFHWNPQNKLLFNSVIPL